MMLSDGPTCAEAILPRGQENGRRMYRQYGRGLRRTHAAKAPGPSGCAAAAARCVAALARCPASHYARLLAVDSPQRNAGWIYLITSCSNPDPRDLPQRTPGDLDVFHGHAAGIVAAQE